MFLHVFWMALGNDRGQDKHPVSCIPFCTSRFPTPECFRTVPLRAFLPILFILNAVSLRTPVSSRAQFFVTNPHPV